ncbi:hypothetical protein E5082_14010 [Streptomyces griseoluteus]|uniref:Uncharacterized protein n=1 Tax=Streptomyces griseoluteus TaxID=29306 RepID=A0A4Z1DJJ6_STRGP|nr:hypothetical protein [Streptomyces griseoluteus]TGN83940.1 hypothetical protein E5082_14010 [Streptomyces griseoluteus]GHF06523.1 hypothetical protein GCM10017776_25430 [Streptomyces griseoluteus]
MPPHIYAVVGTGIGATALAAAGIIYAPTVGSTPASQAVHRVARPAHQAALPVHRAAPVAAPSGDRSASGERNKGHDEGGRDYGHKEDGRIYFNERTYSASADGCITAASSNSFYIFNDSRQTVAVFRGFSCAGSPVAIVGPHDETSGTVPRTDPVGMFGGDVAMFGDDGVVASFRVINDHDEW